MSDTETIEAPQTLAEYKAERLAPPKVEEVKDEPGEVVGEATEVKEEEDEQPKKKAGLQNRFSELTEQRKTAEARAEREAERASAAERERDELKARLSPQPKVDEEAPKPKPEDYPDAFKYAEDLAEWTADKVLKDRDKAEAEKVANQERQKVQAAWNDRLTKAKTDLPDYEDMIASSDVQVSNAVRDAIIESEYGPKILYLLASEPEIAEKLSKLSVLGQLREIGKLEAKYETVPVAKTAPAVERPRAPAPITPVRGTKSDNPVTSDGEFKGSYSEWKAARNRMNK